MNLVFASVFAWHFMIMFGIACATLLATLYVFVLAMKMHTFDSVKRIRYLKRTAFWTALVLATSAFGEALQVNVLYAVGVGVITALVLLLATLLKSSASNA